MGGNELLEMISRGFDKTPSQVFLSIVGILLALALFFAVSRIYFYTVKLKISRSRNADFEKLIRIYDLTINELDFLDTLSFYLFDSENKVVLLKNRNTFLKAVSLWKRDFKSESPLAKSIAAKVFPEDIKSELIDVTASYGEERPVRFITGEGEVYSGRIHSRQKDKLVISHVVKRQWSSDKDRGKVFIQDFKGVLCHNTGTWKTDGDKIEITLESDAIKGGDNPSIESVFLFHKSSDKPLKTRMKLINENTAWIDNDSKLLAPGDTIKLSLRKNIKDIFHINATVLGLSVNRTTAKIRLGHIDDSVALSSR